MDKQRCSKQVWTNASGFGRYVPCSRGAVREGYCKQHHPDAESLRKEARREKRSAETTARYRAFDDAKVGARLFKLNPELYREILEAKSE